MLNEKRLIDAKEAERQIKQALKDINPVGMGLLLRWIRKQPKVDAVEVVHARWEEIGVADYKCSRCGFRFTSADPISMFQYCRCGAKMDGDGNG